MKLKIGIWYKILGGFSILVLILSINAIVNIVTLTQSEKVLEQNANVVQPSADALKKFLLLATRSRMLVTNWVHLPYSSSFSSEDKKALKEIHKKEYKELKDKLVVLSQQWEDSTNRLMLDTVFLHFEKIMEVQKDIMASLKDFSDYESTDKLFVEELVESEILPLFDLVQMRLRKIIDEKEKENEVAQVELVTSFNKLKTLMMLLSLLAVFLAITAAIVIFRSVSLPIKDINSTIKLLSLGILPQQNRNDEYSKDEIGEMKQAVTKLVIAFQETSEFAEKIGRGEYNAAFNPLSEQDVLGNALLKMRNNLKTSSEEGRIRRWTNEGITQVSDILKKHSDDIHILSDALIKLLVKYLGANQGALFTVQGEEEDVYLEMMGCYAWDKKKYLEKRVQKGEGLTGQCWLEGGITYLTEVPVDYVELTSGLGHAVPRAVLIVPMILNEVVFGMLEFASFKKFESYEIQFIKRAGENIAATLSILKNNEKNQRLLEESKLITEQLTAQEEEMRQNMEELQTTQEEISRVQSELQHKNELVEASFFVVELDSRKNVISVNATAIKMLRISAEMVVGVSAYNFFLNETQFDNGLKIMEMGQIWADEMEIRTRKDQTAWVKIAGSAIRNHMGNVKKYVLIMSDISEMKMQEELLLSKQNQVEKQNEEDSIQAQYIIAEQKAIIEVLKEEKEELLLQIQRNKES